MNRREFLGSVGSGAALCALGSAQSALAQSRQFTEWGWPTPYERISDKSIDYLKSKGWWPLAIGSQPGFTGLPVTVGKGFYKARGLEVTVAAFLSGPAINEAAVAGRVQAGVEGNFPFTTLIARSTPVRCIAVANPNIKHATLVPLDSPIKTIADLKKSSEKPAFGIVVGSSAEFYFTEALISHGLAPGRDVTLKNMRPTDMLIMPAGLTGFVQWNPYIWDHLIVRKNARQIDAIFPYNFYMGNLWVYKDIVDNAPDVVQALLDGYVEGILFTRSDLEAAIDITQKDPMYATFPRDTLKLICERINNLYKPNWFYPDRGFWSSENSRVAKWLHQSGRLDVLVTPERYHEYFDVRFADRTLDRLGWNRPQQPSFLPAGWTGKVGQIPYPAYYHEDSLSQPQKFPEPGELKSDWYFGGQKFSI